MPTWEFPKIRDIEELYRGYVGFRVWGFGFRVSQN